MASIKKKTIKGKSEIDYAIHKLFQEPILGRAKDTELPYRKEVHIYLY